MKHFTTARYGLSIHTARPSRLRRAAFFLAWCALVAAAVFLLLAAVGPAPASANDGRPYSPQREAERQELFRVYVRSSWCMADAARAALRVGYKREDDVREFAAKACGSQMKAFLTNTPPRWTAADADRLVRGMAAKAVADVLGDGQL